ncbi:hypothetical protein CH352_00820 [Leptospira hartskeerlii]|uniref:RNA-directed DNA polymerase n=1 Tax=Leptospira hartskeerlii TaxID=2023177 RepID=A0A2M9X8C6_9LEPT|nr:reverse transcriptase family protein [Leptospira hartskeerlii]PJZ23947.1 hypothetical protein CH357_18400 [Leptospira hartskeerlii]PJZ35211.1 hypothetical protein CH352_00820 [Leptospira hartskeerlii]
MLLLDFPNIRHKGDLIKYFQTNTETFDSVLVSKNKFAHVINIPKKKGGNREVIKLTNEDWKRFLKQINFSLHQLYTFPNCVQGFIPGRGIKSNSYFHLKNRQLLVCDIKDFYYSIKESDISNIFKYFKASDEIANLLAKLCTFEGILFPGLNTSPTLANLYCEKMDEKLSILMTSHQGVYTRYADDLTFSSNQTLPNLKDISELLENYNFKLQERKTRYSSPGQRQYVTGLSISDKRVPRLPRNFKRNIRLLVHLAEKLGVKEYHENLNSRNLFTLKGQLVFAMHIEPIFAKKYLVRLNRLI